MPRPLPALSGKGAVVTGGASGIGAGTARALADAGAYVVIGDLDASRGRAEQIVGAYPAGRVTFVACDVTRKADLEALAAAAAALPCRGASLWYNNAGITTEGPGGDLIHDYDSKLWKLQQDINIHAVIEGTQVAYKHMREMKVEGDKYIIATASMAGLLPQASPVYCANKAAVNHFTRSMAVRLGMEGVNDVRCYSICPTFTDTPLFFAPGKSKEVTKASMQAIGGVALVDDIVDGVFDLVEQRAPSGTVLRVTLRAGGRKVVRDVMPYGREQGGPLDARDGAVTGERPVGDAERGRDFPDAAGAATAPAPAALAGRGAVITGAASGIGLGAARALADAGAYVVVGDLASQRAKVAEFAAAYPAGRVSFVPCDVTQKADLEALASAAAALPCRGASLWYNNAGIATEHEEDLLAHYSGRKWRAQQAINLDAVIEGTQVAYKHMRDMKVAGDKFILATASMAGLLPQASPVYCANKAGVNHFTRSMAVRLAMEGVKDVRCYSICPTFTDTPLWRANGPQGMQMQRKAIGGVARVQDMVDGVLDLVARKPPSGTVMRVTLRRGGRYVVRDVMPYGKEAGGREAAREGKTLGERTIGADEKAAGAAKL